MIGLAIILSLLFPESVRKILRSLGYFACGFMFAGSMVLAIFFFIVGWLPLVLICVMCAYACLTVFTK